MHGAIQGEAHAWAVSHMHTHKAHVSHCRNTEDKRAGGHRRLTVCDLHGHSRKESLHHSGVPEVGKQERVRSFVCVRVRAVRIRVSHVSRACLTDEKYRIMVSVYGRNTIACAQAC
jgi:hypothetical protein